jgi:hypothetical protein
MEIHMSWLGSIVKRLWERRLGGQQGSDSEGQGKSCGTPPEKYGSHQSYDYFPSMS